MRNSKGQQPEREKRIPFYLLAGLAVLLLAFGLVALSTKKPGTPPPTGTLAPTSLPPTDSPTASPGEPTLPTTDMPAVLQTITPTKPWPTARPASTTTLPPTATPTPAVGRLPFFGVSPKHVTDEYGLQQARQAGVQVIRDPTLSWKKVEPERTEPPTYHWELIRDLELELINAAESGMTVTLLILFAPDWAQAVPGHSCGAIREDRLDEFAQFLQAAVHRYSGPPYYIKYWELFNEPDVDPDLVGADSVFGCWGDDDDEFYGGRTFAHMLQKAYPAIKEADPQAQVIFGGLLLDAPQGRPTQFLRGVLEAGGGDYFDLLAFHAYTGYSPTIYNWDVLTGTKWIDWHGVVIGKTTFLRQTLGRYGYDKRLLLNEVGLAWFGPEQPTDDYRQAQADYVAQVYTRGLALGLENVTWYGWRGPGWRHMALLNADLSPKPAYHAYAFARLRLTGVRYVGPTDYAGLEGYVFQQQEGLLQVVWSADGREHKLRLPANRLVQAFDCLGQPVTPRIVQDRAVFNIRRPLYLELTGE